MFLPAFILEDEDIDTMKSEGIFLGEYIDKITGTRYFKLNSRKFQQLIDLIYDNGLISDKDKSSIEFDFRVATHIFTSIILKENRLEIVSAILDYYKINSTNAKALMSIVGWKDEVK